MTKRKQATLFSLKSWKNVASDNIQKYKEILANLDESDSEILKALLSLKRKNPSRDVILSARIDLCLESLERHRSPIVCQEAQMLRKHWQLNNNCISEIVVIDEAEPLTKKQRTLPETEICEMKTTKKQTIECKVQAISHPQAKQLTNGSFLKYTKESVSSPAIKPTKLPNEGFLMNMKECMTSAAINPTKLPNEAFLMDKKESEPLADIKQTKLVFKSSSTSRATYNTVMRQLCDAVKLFTQELGEQEVRFYLEKH